MWLQPLSHWLLAVTITAQMGGGPALTPGQASDSRPGWTAYGPNGPASSAPSNSPMPSNPMRQPAANSSSISDSYSSRPSGNTYNSYPPANREQSSTPARGMPATTGPLPDITPMRQASFSIPFRLNQTSDPTQQPVGAQLFVSTDRGAKWQYYANASATQKQFDFRAGGDGEYWFAVKTVTRSGQAYPEQITTPGLRIVVDTQAPSLNISPRQGDAGQVVVHWEANEPNLKPNSLKIYYRVSAVAPWQSVIVDPQSPQLQGSRASGDVVFQPTAGNGEIQIRAEVSDAAGNVGTANGLVRLAQLANNAGAGNGSEAVTSGTNPPIGRRYAPPVVGAAPNPFGLPPGERPRMVNSKSFELEYDIDSVGPSGIGKVELWGTRDNGRTWRRFATDPDNRSPMSVQVDDEGMYGFRVVVTNGAGLGGRPPIDGDQPDLWLGVDLTKPTARIIAAQHGTDAETGHLIITWQADDQLLAARPVSLSFSENASGPWTPIASGLENTGRYAWPMDGRLPGKVFLRLEVRDEAGNVAESQTPQAIAVDQSRPTARVRGIRPVGRSSVQ